MLTSRRKEEAAGRPCSTMPRERADLCAHPAAPAGAAEADTAEPAKTSFTSLLYWEDLAQMCDRSEVRQYMEAVEAVH